MNLCISPIKRKQDAPSVKFGASCLTSIEANYWFCAC